jgi:hypothetical protein
LALICADEALEPINDALRAFDARAFTFIFTGAAQEKLNAIFTSGQ